MKLKRPRKFELGSSALIILSDRRRFAHEKPQRTITVFVILCEYLQRFSVYSVLDINSASHPVGSGPPWTVFAMIASALLAFRGRGNGGWTMVF